MDQYLWLAAESRQEVITLAEAGEWEEGDGLRVGLIPNFLVVTVKTPERDCEVAVPVMELLDAIATLTAKHGN